MLTYIYSIPDLCVLIHTADVLKARLKTIGVSEYKFEMELSAGRDSGTEWRIVDVGGSRSQVDFVSSLHLSYQLMFFAVAS